MNKYLPGFLILLIHAAPLGAADTNHSAQLKLLTEQRDNAVKAVVKPIDEKYHVLLLNLQKSAAAASDFETVTAIQKILHSDSYEPTMEDYFPAGSKWTGMRSGGADAASRVRYKAISSTTTTAVIEYENERGTWEVVLLLVNGLIRMESIKAINVQNPSRLYDIQISGRMEQLNEKKRLELKGSWKWKNSITNRQDEVTDIRLVMEEL